MKYKVYDGITKNLSDVTLNTMDDAKSLIDREHPKVCVNLQTDVR